MNESFTKADAEQPAIDINDPLELIKLLSSEKGREIRNKAETEAVNQQIQSHHAAQRAPLSLSIPEDWQNHPKHFCIVHHTTDAAHNLPRRKGTVSSGSSFGAPSAPGNTIVKNTTEQDDWQPTGCGTLSNNYLFVPLESKSTGRLYTVHICAGVTYIPSDLFDGEFSSAPLREAVERGVIDVLPPGIRFEARQLSKQLRTKMAEGAAYFAQTAADLRWHAELVEGTDIGKALLRKAASLEE